ncbi:hypothetical protein LEP1GSC191_1418 [Leptospira borgpetersenii serovar Mini str. 201000851]|nr:hypothetical protein LEP1GSC055_0953 [Leptospira borgpetersenii str. Brem 307]ENO64102.1 hypothetical protein LEP1GSC191_1418 [Leptospira borgpetersenii serovar Mini str. 201000851]
MVRLYFFGKIFRQGEVGEPANKAFSKCWNSSISIIAYFGPIAYLGFAEKEPLAKLNLAS